MKLLRHQQVSEPVQEKLLLGKQTPQQLLQKQQLQKLLQGQQMTQQLLQKLLTRQQVQQPAQEMPLGWSWPHQLMERLP